MPAAIVQGWSDRVGGLTVRMRRVCVAGKGERALSDGGLPRLDKVGCRAGGAASREAHLARRKD